MDPERDFFPTWLMLSGGPGISALAADEVSRECCLLCELYVLSFGELHVLSFGMMVMLQKPNDAGMPFGANVSDGTKRLLRVGVSSEQSKGAQLPKERSCFLFSRCV